jgi:hypothetical protein
VPLFLCLFAFFWQNILRNTVLIYKCLHIYGLHSWIFCILSLPIVELGCRKEPTTLQYVCAVTCNLWTEFISWSQHVIYNQRPLKNIVLARKWQVDEGNNIIRRFIYIFFIFSYFFKRHIVWRTVCYSVVKRFNVSSSQEQLENVIWKEFIYIIKD